MEARPIDANALKLYFSDKQMECARVDETDYTFNALMFDVLGDVITAIENAPTIAEKETATWYKTKNPQWGAYSWDTCSNCGWMNTRYAKIGKGNKSTNLKFCPCCGAMMENKENG